MLEVVRHIPEEDLIASMRNVTLLHDKSVKPWAEADMRIETIRFDQFRPATLYVLNKALAQQLKLREELREIGHDPLELEGGLRLDDGTREVGLTPPFIENDPEYGPLLVDGAHRCYLGREMARSSLLAVIIRNPLPAYPINAFPNDWRDVVRYDETPTNPRQKKRYREPDDKERLYRDLSALNGSVSRQAGSVL